ncbi:lanthionine synthetase LanC family protein [Chitinophaga sp. XS-30]|uniref:lanthionine synthetase LanC family protein n=1 Tax=Chitinophaga sp. XS-30 TaxID=2604421 RepID=UPI0011DD8676|nr:lanthionine synthetase LanC family protein [Chitinophaga sp. XS-30]QEH42201.1 protein kinase [Chitinophaga sp. XS-30]
MSIVAKTIIDQVDEEPVKYQKSEKKSGNRIGYNYIILKSLKESKKNDVVKCLYIKSLTRFGFCVIKEGTSGDSKDKHGRDIRDRLMWQEQLHAMLQDKIRMPRLLGSFEENGNYYLVIERIRGKSLHTVFKEGGNAVQEGLLSGNKTGMKFLDYLVRIVEILEVMHQHQVVHRDVTLNNFMIMPGGKVAIIDMELSYSLAAGYPSPPFQLGTIGYMSPEQELIAVPTVKEDIFSIGAIMLQLWTGISPYKLTTVSREELQRKVEFLMPDKLLADLVARCMDPEPERRPLAGEIKNFLLQYERDKIGRSPRATVPRILFSQNEILDTIQKGIFALSTSLMADSEKGWFSEDMKNMSEEKSKINKAWYASFNRGASGIIYFLANAKRMGFDVSLAQSQIKMGIELIKNKYIDRADRHTPGLHFGSDGIAVALVAAMNSGLIENKEEYRNWINQLLTDSSDHEDVVRGMAGQGIANLLCAAFLKQETLDERLIQYATLLVAKQDAEGYWMRSFNESGRRRIIPGFGSGMSGIIYYLLLFGQKFNHGDSLEAAERGLSWLIRKAVRGNGTMDWKSSSGKQLSFSLLEGSPGISLSFLKAFDFFQKESYRNTVGQILVTPNPGLSFNNLSQSFGLSGVASVYLQAANVLDDKYYVEQAGSIVQFLCHVKKIKEEKFVHWFVEHERQPVANFMMGNTGILHALLQYCFRDKISIPFLL